MKNVIVLVVFCLIAMNLYSQQDGRPVDFSAFGTPISGSSASYINRSIVDKMIHDLERVNQTGNVSEYLAANFDGTPFMNNEFVKGDVVTVKGEVLKDVLLRYNVYSDVMEGKLKDVCYEIDSKGMVKRVTLEGKTYDYLKYKIDNDEKFGYLELLEDGEWKLYRHHIKKFKEAQPPRAMQESGSKAKFSDLPAIYFLMKEGDETAVGFRNNKDLVNIFTDNKNEVQDFIKSNKLKSNNQEDLKKLLSYDGIKK